MAPITKTGNEKGFTLIELLVVMTIVAILATIAIPNYQSSITRAREAVLLENLFQVRDALDKYRTDKGNYPATIEDLVMDKYIRSLPKDPFTNSNMSWTFTYDDTDGGIYDIHSSSEKIGRNMIAYSQW